MIFICLLLLAEDSLNGFERIVEVVLANRLLLLVVRDLLLLHLSSSLVRTWFRFLLLLWFPVSGLIRWCLLDRWLNLGDWFRWHNSWLHYWLGLCNVLLSRDGFQRGLGVHRRHDWLLILPVRSLLVMLVLLLSALAKWGLVGGQLACAIPLLFSVLLIIVVNILWIIVFDLSLGMTTTLVAY